MKPTFIMASAILAATNAFAEPATTKPKPTPWPSQVPKPNTPSGVGCFSSKGDMVAFANVNTTTFNSLGSCVPLCKENGKTVAATHLVDCFCGTFYPPKASSVELTHCDYPCPGIDTEACAYRPYLANRLSLS